MGGIKSYKIHIKLDLMYPLFVEKILIPSRINSLQIMYSKAVARTSIKGLVLIRKYSRNDIQIIYRIVSIYCLKQSCFQL